MSRCMFALLGLLAAASVSAQTAQLRTYTHVEAGSGQIPLGYPVPQPIASLTPVDGFRDYASLEARLQSLALGRPEVAAHAVGSTIHGRSLWAYTVGTAGTDVEGRPPAAFFINATTHAREWAAPEVATGLVERMAASAAAGDRGLAGFLLDNTRLVIIPVHNIDGLLQTQRFPSLVLVGQDPCSPSGWPRDGRMRRKNMRGADESLATVGDHLNGVDLNRNHPPLWRTSVFSTGCGSGSSNNPNSLVFHGAAAHSEPENQALRQAATLAPASRIRLGIDIHSYARVFFSSNTARTRLNDIQRKLIAAVGAHHAAQPTHDRAVNGVTYTDVPDPPNRGIGAAAEYFAYEWLVPAWTLELEPGSGGQEYGGFGVSHDGFILPASQARRVREAWAESHLVAFYYMAGPPHLARVRLLDAATGQLLREHRWDYDPQTQRRVAVASGDGRIAPGQALIAQLSFNKPMRHRINGEVAALPGQPMPAPPAVAWVGDSGRTVLDSAAGAWGGAQTRLRYDDDTYAFSFNAPAGRGAFALEVVARDMVGLALDADPQTPVDWQAGAWAAYEGDDSSAGDVGGADAVTARLMLPLPTGEVQIAAPQRVGEGDRVRLRLRRDIASDQPISLVGESPEAVRLRAVLSPPPPPAPAASWAAGETGERVMDVLLADDTALQGERTFTVSLSRLAGGDAELYQELDVRVLDNDRPGRPVLRRRAAWGPSIQSSAGASDAMLDLVLDRSADFHLLRLTDAAASPRWQVDGRITVYGNGSTVSASPPGLPTCSGIDMVAVGAGAELVLDQLALRGQGNTDRCGLRNAGRLELRRSTLDNLQPSGGYSLESSGELRIDRSALLRYGENSAAAGTLRVSAGRADIVDSLLAAPSQPLLLQPGRSDALVLDGGEVQIDRSTLSGLPAVDRRAGPAARIGGSVLYEHLQTLFLPPIYTRPTCTAPAVIGSGGTLYAVHYDGGSVTSLEQSGCIQPAAGERFVNERWESLLGSDRPDPAPPAGSAAIDAHDAALCQGRDMRGRPRPQSASGDVRCDSGAIEIGINPYRGLWIPDRDGHGIDMQTAGNTLFLLWYTYADDGQPTAYQAAAALTGPRWRATLQQPRRSSGGEIVLTDVGEIGIDFDNNSEARLSWRFTGRAEGSERMRAYRFAEGEPRVEVTGTWFPPAENGNGASIVRRGEVTAALLYYYDAAGNLRWALGSGDDGDVVEMQMLGYTGFCPDCTVQTMPVSHRPIGRALLHFLSPQRLRVDSDLTYPGPAGGRWLRENADFVPIGDPVDNSLTLSPPSSR